MYIMNKHKCNLLSSSCCVYMVSGLSTLYWTVSYVSLSQWSLIAYSSFSKNATPRRFSSPSMLAYLLTLTYFRFCLCSHVCEGLFYRRLLDILALTTFLPPLPWCSMSHRFRSYDVDESIGTGLPTICWSLQCAQLWFSVTISICYRKEASWMRMAPHAHSYL